MSRRVAKTKFKTSLKLVASSLCVAFFADVSLAASFSMTYSGRLTQQTGAPVDGPVDVTVKFWTSATAGNTLGTPIDFANVALNQGVFTLPLELTPAQISAIFGDGTDPVFIEVTAAGKTYPRQHYTYVPLALRVPVDNKTLAFDADGKLGLSLTSLPSANQFLTKDSNGRLSWGSPAVTTLQGQTIAAATPSSGQVLTFNGGQWVPTTITSSGSGSGSSSGLQPAGNYLTGLTGDVVATGPGSGSATLASVALPGTATKITFDVKGRVTAGSSLTSADITAALGYAPLNKDGSTPLTGNWAVGGKDITGVGNLALSNNTTFALGAYTTDPTSLTAIDAGKMWYNGGALKFWNGSAVQTLGISGAGLTTLNGMTGNTQTFTVGTSGNTPAISSASNVHTLNIPLASAGAAVTAGLISNADYAAFNSKVGSVAAGSGVTISTTGNIATVNLATAGTAGTYAKVTTDAYGRVSIGTTLSAADIPPIPASLITSGTLDPAQLPTAGTAGTYAKVTTDAKGRVTAGSSLTSADITAALGYAPLNKDGSTPLTGNWAVGGKDITGVGNLALSNNTTFALGAYTTDPTSLTAIDAGKMWYNGGALKFWNGSAVQTLGISGAGLTTLNGMTGNTQTFTVGTSGNTPAISSVSNVHTLNIPLASAGTGVTAGLISNSDYAAFNSKVGSVAAGTGISVTNSSGSVTVSFAATGSAGTFTKVSTNAQGQVTSGTTLANSDIPELDASKITSGQIGVARGGTGLASGNGGGIPYFSDANTLASSSLLTANGIVLGGGSNGSPTSTAALSNGQLLIGSTGAAPVPASLSSGANAGVTVTNGPGSITLDTVQDIRPTASPTFATLNATTLASATYVAGSSDNSATPTAGMLRAANAVGSDAVGANLVLASGNGTGTGGSGSIQFNTAAADTTGASANTLATRMTITPSGNVGIGTTSPQANLEVVSSATTNTAAENVFAPSLTAANYVQRRLGVSGAINNSSEMRFYYAGSGSTSNRLDLGFYGSGNGLSELSPTCSPLRSVPFGRLLNSHAHNFT